MALNTTLQPVTPETEGRLISTVQFYAFPQFQLVGYENIGLLGSILGVLGAANRDIQNLLQSYGEFASIGQILNFKREQTRNTNKFFSLGKHSLEPRFVAPGRITTKIMFERVMLYNQDLIQFIGFAGGHLLYQYFPFVIY